MKVSNKGGNERKKEKTLFIETGSDFKVSLESNLRCFPVFSFIFIQLKVNMFSFFLSFFLSFSLSFFPITSFPSFSSWDLSEKDISCIPETCSREKLFFLQLVCPYQIQLLSLLTHGHTHNYSIGHQNYTLKNNFIVWIIHFWWFWSNGIHCTLQNL